MKRAWRSSLEFVAQGELHYARVGQQTGVVAKLGAESVDRVVRALCIEPGRIGTVEDLPAQL